MCSKLIDSTQNKACRSNYCTFSTFSCRFAYSVRFPFLNIALYRPTPGRPRRPPCTGRHRNGQEDRPVQADTGTAKKTALYWPTPGRPKTSPCTGRHRDGQKHRPVQADTGTAKKTALYRPTPGRPKTSPCTGRHRRRRPPCTGRHRNGRKNIIGGSCHQYIFCRDKHVFSRNKSMLVATKLISVCRDKIFLLRKNFCRDNYLSTNTNANTCDKNDTCGSSRQW